jgi:hypothetical protein
MDPEALRGQPSIALCVVLRIVERSIGFDDQPMSQT